MMSQRKILGSNYYLANNMNVERAFGFNDQYRTVKKGLGMEMRNKNKNEKQNDDFEIRQKYSQKSNSQIKSLNSNVELLEEKNKGNEQQQLMQLRQYYKNCLRAKKQLQRRCQQLQTQNRLLLISQKSIQELKQQNKTLNEQLNHYKSELFTTKDRLKHKDQEYMNKIIIGSKQLQMKLEISEESSNLKAKRLQKQIDKMQLQNYYLQQQIITLKNQLKVVSIQKDQLQHIRENKPYNKNTYQNKLQISFRQQYQNTLKKQYETKLKRTLQSINQQNQLELINLQSQLQMEKFKFHTVNQQYKHLQLKSQKINDQLSKVKKQNHDYLHINDDLNKKCLDFSYLIKQVISKIQQISPNQSQTLLQYIQIVKDKLSRIQQGKNVTYLQSNTKNFLPINWRYQQSKNSTFNHSQNHFLQNLFNSLNKDVQQKDNSYQCLQNIEIDEQETTDIPQNQKRFTFNPYESLQEQSYLELQQVIQSVQQKNHSPQKVKQKQRQDNQFENKILRQRNAIQARIRAKYQSEKKGFDYLSHTKENFTNIKQKQNNPHLKYLDNVHINKDKQRNSYLTKQFSFDLQK